MERLHGGMIEPADFPFPTPPKALPAPVKYARFRPSSGGCPARTSLKKPTGEDQMHKTMRYSLLASATVLLFGVSGGAQAQQVPQSPNMSFFVTSVGSGKGGDLGGMAGADAHCQQLATAAGAGNKVWRAYLSGPETPTAKGVNARDRIG